MAKLTQLNGFQVAGRLSDLREFRDLFCRYTYELSPSERPFGDPELTPEGQDIKRSMDTKLFGVIETMGLAGTYTIVDYTAPPALGGTRRQIDPMRNIDQLHRYEIHPRHIVSMIDTTIGVLERELRPAWIRTFWPFYWIHRMVARLIAYPFDLWSDATGSKTSAVTAFLQGTGTFLGTLAADVLVSITVLEKLGFLDAVINWLRTIFH
ncbi:MAG: hypothetical protein KBC96_13900 [Armatimonadetes bacterium]|nr:hypothetical protein [Armatimonadota bacterium]